MAEPFTCPDCGALWDPGKEDQCPGCLLSREDLEAAAEFLDDIEQERRT